MYENEENGEVKEEDVGSILEIMLGVENIELACVFLCLDNPDAEHMTYGKMQFLFLVSHVLNTGKDRPWYLRTFGTTELLRALR